MSKRILARRGKKKKTTARVVFVELFTKGEYILCLRLTSKLVDLRQGYANSFTHSVNEVESSTASAKKKKTTARVVFFFLVEVWRFELQASSTRNWRATNCATPRRILNYKLVQTSRAARFPSENIVVLSQSIALLYFSLFSFFLAKNCPPDTF